MLHAGMNKYFGRAGNHGIPSRSTSLSNLDLDDDKSVVSDISDDRGSSEDDSLHYSDDMDCCEGEAQDVGNVHNDGLASCPKGDLLDLNPISLNGNTIMVSPCQRGNEETVIEQLHDNHGGQSLLQRNISSEMKFSNPSSSSVDLLGVNSYAQAYSTSRIDMNNYKGSMEKVDRAYRENPISLNGNSIMVMPCQRGKEDTVIEQLDDNHGGQSSLQRNISSEITISNPSSSSVDLLGVNSYAQACSTSRIDMNNYKGSMEKVDRAYRENKGFSRQYATPSSISSISTKSTTVPRFIYVTDDADSSAASNNKQRRHRRTLSATSISINTLENLDDEGWDSAKRREFFVNQRDINSKSKLSKEVSYYMSKVIPITRRVNSKKLKLVKSNGLLT